MSVAESLASPTLDNYDLNIELNQPGELSSGYKDFFWEKTVKGRDSIKNEESVAHDYFGDALSLLEEEVDGREIAEILFENPEEVKEVYETLSNAENSIIGKEVGEVNETQGLNIDDESVLDAYQRTANEVVGELEDHFTRYF